MPEEPSAPGPGPAPEKVISSGDLLSYIVGGVVFAVIIGAAIVAIANGRIFTGIFLILAPAAVALMAGLPYRIRQKVPASAVGVAVIALWVAFFWAACGGH